MEAHRSPRRYSGQGPRIYTRRKLPPVERPFPVTCIALFQFLKACLLLAAAVVTRIAPEALHAIPILPALIYVAAHGRNTTGFLLPVVGVYIGFIGLGLWGLKRWARRSLIVSAALMMIIWAHRFYLDWSLNEHTLKNSTEQQAVSILLLLDVVTFFYLVVHDDVPLAFRLQEARD